MTIEITINEAETNLKTISITSTPEDGSSPITETTAAKACGSGDAVYGILDTNDGELVFMAAWGLAFKFPDNQRNEIHQKLREELSMFESTHPLNFLTSDDLTTALSTSLDDEIPNDTVKWLNLISTLRLATPSLCTSLAEEFMELIDIAYQAAGGEIDRTADAMGVKRVASGDFVKTARTVDCEEHEFIYLICKAINTPTDSRTPGENELQDAEPEAVATFKNFLRKYQEVEVVKIFLGKFPEYSPEPTSDGASGSAAGAGSGSACGSAAEPSGPTTSPTSFLTASATTPSRAPSPSCSDDEPASPTSSPR